MKALQRLFWARTLTRQIFIWFGAAILMSVLIVGGLFTLSNLTGHNNWQKEMARWETFTSHHVADQWDDVARRDALIETIARDLEVHARLEDTGGRTLIERGGACESGENRVLIQRASNTLGTLVVCSNRPTRGKPGGILVLLFIIFAGLWVTSALVARGIGRPLRELASVAEAMGQGDLSARATCADKGAEEIVAVTQSLHAMAERIDAQLTAQRRLLAEVSHELRTPLGHLRLITELIREGGATEDQLVELEREIVEMDDLVDQLLATSRLDFDVGKARPLDATEMALQAIERAGLDPTLLEVTGSGTFQGDPALVGRALANLLRNADQHGLGVTGLTVERRGTWLAFLVEDRGPGLPETERQKLFEPFVQRETLTQRGALGLGLYLVHRIAVAHGGDVIAEANEGGGARIGVLVPRVD